MTTSNISSSIDEAFIDRADIKQYIGSPSPKGMYAILSSCIHELTRLGLVYPQETLIDWRAIEFLTNGVDTSSYLYDTCREFHGLSGRKLRKIPFLVFVESGKQKIDISQFMSSLRKIIAKEKSEMI
jgi:SpoVK/Ycf46/Vps4 family AAA+-type ATPase